MPAAFRCRVSEYDSSSAREKLGHLIHASAAAGYATHYLKQTEAWEAELRLVGEACVELVSLRPESGEWWLLFEYEIPRRAKRPDVILLAGDVIFVIEFKIDADAFLAGDVWQAFSYALDLRDFHAESAERTIVPVLMATGAETAEGGRPSEFSSGSSVVTVQRVGGNSGVALAHRIDELFGGFHSAAAEAIDAQQWEKSRYRPTPTIIEAAERLFASHSVADISHTFATNLDVTSRALVERVRESQASGYRTICFVTGSPGAGKTLTGLNAVHDPELRRGGRPSGVFLSGNGPLVKIVREALVRDQQRAGAKRKDAEHTVSAFIGHVHGFIAHYGLARPTEEPHENAIVFDEAQRAWDEGAVDKKHGVCKSEPVLVLDIMERAREWCTVIALVGGGQEIHEGEAGLEEWGRALNASSAAWRVVVSPEALRGGESVAGHQLFAERRREGLHVVEAPEMHLSVSVRSPRARHIGEWVNSLVECRPGPEVAASVVSEEFPVALTRDLDAARQWLRDHTDPNERCGLLASSGALRLRVHGIEVSSGFRKGYSYKDWFLSGREDTRSSHWLEVAATEFECQGLELDWICVCWGGDFVIDPETGRWSCRRFRGTRWEAVRGAIDQRYIANKYRVLLTRARKGMVICVPRGAQHDPTREPVLLDSTAEYLAFLGLGCVFRNC